MNRAEVREASPQTTVLVLEGSVKTGRPVAVLRDGGVVGHATVSSLARDGCFWSEVSQGYEAQIRLEGFETLRVDDLIQEAEAADA